MKAKLTYFLFSGLMAMFIYNCQSNPYAQGEALYMNNCMTCHQKGGQALKKLIPPLAESDFLVKEKSRLACIIKYGIDEKITVNGQEYESVMGAATHLSDVEITNIINYINNNLGNDNGYTSLEEVQEGLEECEDRL